MSKARRSALRRGRRRVRLGPDAQCELCGLDNPEALQVSKDEVLCAECRLLLQAKPPLEGHHLAGRLNDPFTIKIPANDHATLSDAQYDWSDRVLRAGAFGLVDRMIAWLSGLADLASHLSRLLPMWVAFIGDWRRFMVEHYGADWEREVARWAADKDHDGETSSRSGR